MASLFVCPVCGEELKRQEGRYVCPKGHSFDIAKEGYVNLLPANRQHSRAPGDDKAMASARTRFLGGGWYEPLRNELCKLMTDRLPIGGTLLDAGCGEGWYTAALSEIVTARGGKIAGVDLSKPAVKKAAKRCPDGEIAVCSVYHLPVADGSVDVLLNCFSPLAIEEFRRVVKPGGRFFYVVPGPRHLWELKEILYDTPYENEEKVEQYEGFAPPEIIPVETSFTLTDRSDIQALYHMTPYTWKTPKEGAARLGGVERLTVTGQFRVHIMQKRG